MSDHKKPSMDIDVAMVRKLSDILDERDLTEIELEDGEKRIYIARRQKRPLGRTGRTADGAFAQRPGSALSSNIPSDQGNLPPSEDEDVVKSPMRGTVKLSPDEQNGNFVSEGDQVKAGDTLLLIEAMDVDNPILAPHSGIVRDIFVESGQKVAFDQPLVHID